MIRMKKVLPLLQSSFLRLSSSSIQICFSEVVGGCIKWLLLLEARWEAVYYFGFDHIKGGESLTMKNVLPQKEKLVRGEVHRSVLM